MRTGAPLYILPCVAQKNQRTPRGPHQLPPGRHGLSRSFVARNQRQRILAAVAEATAARGYARMSVEDVVRRAGVSRRTFYELFTNKDQVFLEAYDQAANLLLAGVRAANEGESGFAERVAAGFRAFLESLEASPDFARMCIVEVMAAGPEAVAKRTAVMGEFAALMEETAAAELDSHGGVPAIHAETIVAGVYEARVPDDRGRGDRPADDAVARSRRVGAPALRRRGAGRGGAAGAPGGRRSGEVGPLNAALGPFSGL